MAIAGLIKVCLLQKDDLSIAIMAAITCCLYRGVISPAGAEPLLTYQLHEATIGRVRLQQQDAEAPPPHLQHG